MKTNHIVSAFRNAASPVASLAAWQNRPLHLRRRSLADYYVKTATLTERRKARIAQSRPELSGPEAEKPLLWLPGESDSEILETFAGREFLDHRGWYADECQDETLETYAVRLKRFPRLLFYGVLDSCNGDIRVDLSEWEEIDFSDCESDYHVTDAIRDSAKSVVRSNEDTTRREAEESIEYYRRDRAERDIEENKETIAILRHEIRALCHELKSLCQSSMSDLYPVAAKAVRDALRSLLRDRRELMATNAELSASL